jgi:hypothetical protein
VNPAAGDPHALGLAQLRQDPQFARIEPGRHDGLVAAALEDGRFLAADVRASLGADPVFIAASCGVPVIDSGRDAGYGSVLVFAEYATRPPSITLYLPAIRRLDAAIARAGLPGIASTRPLFLAHELYHHFDCTRSEPIARRHTVRLFGFGRWHWTSGLVSLAEIAAGAFAQSLLDLPFHPKFLESVFSRQFLNHRGHGEHGGGQE